MCFLSKSRPPGTVCYVCGVAAPFSCAKHAVHYCVLVRQVLQVFHDATSKAASPLTVLTALGTPAS